MKAIWARVVAFLRRIFGRATGGPWVGAPVWWHSRELRVTEVTPDGYVRFAGHGYRARTHVSQMEFDKSLGRFTLGYGTVDLTPKMVRGEEVFPPEPTCPVCGFRTLRAKVCLECREKRAADVLHQAGKLSDEEHAHVHARVNEHHRQRMERLAAIREGEMNGIVRI